MKTEARDFLSVFVPGVLYSIFCIGLDHFGYAKTSTFFTWSPIFIFLMVMGYQSIWGKDKEAK